MALPHGGKGVDNASARSGDAREDVDVRAWHVLLLRRAELAKSSQGVSSGLQQAGRPATAHPRRSL